VDDPSRSPGQVAPVCTWLASESAQGVTGQIINVMRGTVGIMQQPAVIRSFENGGDHLWTLDELDRAMPRLLAAKEEHDARVKEAGRPETID
jgi:hypothetical protein